MEGFEKSPSVFAILTPANNAARDSFSQVAQKKFNDKDWNPNARQNIKADKQPVQVSTYSSASESDGGTGPSATLRPVLTGYYTFDLAKPPRQPDKGWLIGGGKFSGGEERPEILLTERKKHDGVSSRHARLAHNFASGALVITASDSNVVYINGHDLVDDQRFIHGRTTSLEFGSLKYKLEVRKYEADEDYRDHLNSYKHKHALGDDDYPSTLLATPADSDLITENYVMKNPVGDGATSVVYAAHERRSGHAVAIKKIRRTKKNAKAIMLDVHISQYIGEHPRICHLIEFIDPATDDPNRGYEMFGLDEVFLVYTPLANWTVQKLIGESMALDDQTREKIFWQLLEGIEFLHSIEVMHRDIKPLNMTVVSVNPDHPEARLIDFGMAKKGLESYEYTVGTSSYLAPEIWAGLDGKSYEAYDERVDIFAFGLSMYQFFCHQLCGWKRIDEDINGEVNNSTILEILHRLRESGIPKDLISMISNFIDPDPRRRPSAREAIRLGGRKQSVNNHDEAESLTDDGECDELEDGYGGIGSSMGSLSISGPGRRSYNRSSRERGSRERWSMSEYEPSSHYRSSPIRGPREWDTSGHERTYRSSRY